LQPGVIFVRSVSQPETEGGGELMPPVLADLVGELCRDHPRYRRATIARLVARTVDERRREVPGESVEDLVAAVTDITADQLSYVDRPLPRSAGDWRG
jgi:hypothetical protein